MFNVLLVNDIACGTLVEALAALRRSPYYVHDVKRRCGQISRWREDYERRIKYIVGEQGERFMLMCDAYTERLAHDVQVFFFAFKQAYDRDNVPDAELLSRLQLARWFAEIAGCVYVDRLRHEIVRGRKYTYLDFRPLARSLGQLIHTHFPASDAIECEDGHTAAAILVRKLSDGGIIADAINAAV